MHCRRLIPFLLVVAAHALAAVPELRIPPSDGWEAVADPVPQPGTTDGHFFVWKQDRNVRLRVATAPALHADYSSEYVLKLAAQMGEEFRTNGKQTRITEGLSFEVDGARVAKLQLADNASRTILWWLPAGGGDVIVSLMGTESAWDARARNDVERMVTGAKHLRRPGLTPDESVELAVTVLLGVLVSLAGIGGLVALVARRRVTRPPAAPH